MSVRIALFTLACAGLGQAAAIVETGDAGNLPGTAQVVSGLTGADTLSGNISFTSGVDMYAIFLTGGAFGATTVGQPGTLGDPQLFLFDSAGIGVAANDDGGSNLDATLSLGAPTPGLYYLAISSYDNDPNNANGLIFPSSPFGPQYGPTGPGGALPVTGWSGGGGTGSYTIELRGASSAAVPEPSSMVLIGGGLAALGLLRRRAGR